MLRFVHRENESVNRPLRIVCALIVLFACSAGPLFAADKASAEPSQYSLGDQTMTVNVGAFVPLFLLPTACGSLRRVRRGFAPAPLPGRRRLACLGRVRDAPDPGGCRGRGQFHPLAECEHALHAPLSRQGILCLYVLPLRDPAYLCRGHEYREVRGSVHDRPFAETGGFSVLDLQFVVVLRAELQLLVRHAVQRHDAGKRAHRELPGDLPERALPLLRGTE